MAKELNILAISYAKRLLEENSREQHLLKKYATVLDSYNVIVFTRAKDNLPEIYQEGTVTVYGTNTRTRFGMVWKSYLLGRKILATDVHKKWVITSQDPFVSSVVGGVLSYFSKNRHHVQLHGDSFSDVVPKSLVQKIWNIFGLCILRHAQAIRVVSERTKKSLVKKGIETSKIIVLPIQQNIDAFLSVAKDRSYIGKKNCTFLFVGRLAPEKNIQRIIRAFALAYLAEPDIRLRIVGQGPCEKELQELVVHLGISDVVQLVPWTDNISQDMKEADVFLLSSLHEGYGLVLIEAMASGLPIITTDVGCVGEVLEDGIHGIVVSQDSDKEYSNAILKLFKEEEMRSSYGTQGHKKIRSTYTPLDVYVQRWKETFLDTV